MNAKDGKSSLCISSTPSGKSSGKRAFLSPITNRKGNTSRRGSRTVSSNNPSVASDPVTPSTASTSNSYESLSPSPCRRLRLGTIKPTITASEKQPQSNSGIELVHDPSPGSFARIRHLKFEGCGEVVAARELDLQWILSRSCGRIVALKVFEKKKIEEEDLKDILLNELDAYRKMDKSRASGRVFIMWPSTSFETPDHVVFLMDFLPWTLSDILVKDRKRRQDFKRQWIAQLARGISAIHATGLIHRDIRPENIFLDGHYNVRIGGFARVYVYRSDKVNPEDLSSREITGTWPYMAPEVIKLAMRRRKAPYSAAVDYWSLGCIVYELESMTRKRRPLFEKYKHVIQYAAYQAIEVPYPPFEGMPEHAQSLIYRLVCLDPDKRMGNTELRRHQYFKNGSGASEFIKLGRAPSKQPTDIPWVEMDDEAARRSVVYHPLNPLSPSAVNGKVDFSQFRWNHSIEVPVKKRKPELVLFSG